VEKTLKYELRRCDVENMDKIAQDLKNTARRHTVIIKYFTGALTN